MIVSMTGFGDASGERNGTHYSVEIRSLNNRFFKPIIKLPDTVSGLEPDEAVALLRNQEVQGTDEELQPAVSYCAGHAFSLSLLLRGYIDSSRGNASIGSEAVPGTSPSSAELIVGLVSL